MSWVSSMVPHACFYIDTTVRATLEGLEILSYSPEDENDRNLTLEDIDRIWNNETKDFHILPCLSVRSGLDLFLRAKNFPPGSEIVVSAINIPSMVKILKHHQLRIKSCDLNIFTMAPSMKKFEALITEKTVAVLVAHIYGKRFDMQPIVDICKTKDILVLEDCAEAFTGFHYTGHPESDISFFSFGSIKFSTAFGGALLKFKSRQLFGMMNQLHNSYPVQSRAEYGQKLAKYTVLTTLVNSPFIVRWGVSAFRMVGIDHKDIFVPMLRGFPNSFFEKIRHRPCLGLLKHLVLRLVEFDEEKHLEVKRKGDYLTSKLPQEVIVIGQQAMDNSYWLYPILVEHPVEFAKRLFSQHGIDASRGTTQLQIIYNEGVNGTRNNTPYSVTHAKFLMDHVVYLPCHKLIPYEELDKIAIAVHKVSYDLRCKKLEVPQFV